MRFLIPSQNTGLRPAIRRSGCQWLLMALLWLHAIAAQAETAPARHSGVAQCDGAYASVLTPAAPALAAPARAYWLNQSFIQWPGMQATPGDRFYLYASANAGLTLRAGEQVHGADQRIPLQITAQTEVPADSQARFRFIAGGQVLRHALSRPELSKLLTQQVLLVQESEAGEVRQYTGLQIAGVLDDLYQAADEQFLGADTPARKASASRQTGTTSFHLWAPVAQHVAVCIYPDGQRKASSVFDMQPDPQTGIWHGDTGKNLDGQYYRYLVDVYVPGKGIVRNLVTDPYSVSLNTNSGRSYITNLQNASLKPGGWDQQTRPDRVRQPTDMAVYELHVRDFSVNDASVRPAYRGKFMAFTEMRSDGMRHLQALSKAGITDIHLLPVFDIASVPEKGCVTPHIQGAADGETQQAVITRFADRDCFNWGYDPLHYNAPEGSYASSAENGAQRILEFRNMVMALHRHNLRVGMDVVYNHTMFSGQHPKSVLDRIVPGYYYRLNSEGKIEESTCQPCGNTATENRMMGKLMRDSVRMWAREYKIDSFRFDLMGHQPRAVMENIRTALRNDNGRDIQLIGEGWNFGEVANDARFVQATQLSLHGSGIGTFSDRARDAIRGAGPGDDAASIMRNQGYINGMADAPNDLSVTPSRQEQSRTADMVRVGLAGSLRDYRMQTADGQLLALREMDYNGQPAGYTQSAAEVVNYVENHDNQTLFDINAFRLPVQTSHEDRARVQILGLGLTAFSQGIAYFHAGSELLRSKSLDGNSFNSGDWFNRLDWRGHDNYFGNGLPPAEGNAPYYPLMRPLLRNSLIKPRPTDIAMSRDAFLDLLRIRNSTPLFHLNDAAEVQQRLHFYNTGPDQNPAVIAAHLDGRGLAGNPFAALMYFINVSQHAQTLAIPEQQHLRYQLHPVHMQSHPGDPRIAAEARYLSEHGTFVLPARSVVCFVRTD